MRTILDLSFRTYHSDDLQARLDELEQFVLRKQEEDALDRARRVHGGEEEGS